MIRSHRFQSGRRRDQSGSACALCRRMRRRTGSRRHGRRSDRGGGLGTLGGVALSALDSFVLDRMLKGWKPNQFVEGPLRRFLDGEKT